jgi:hypothetical protein
MYLLSTGAAAAGATDIPDGVPIPCPHTGECSINPVHNVLTFLLTIACGHLLLWLLLAALDQQAIMLVALVCWLWDLFADAD